MTMEGVKCSRCGGSLRRDDGEIKCFQCGGAFRGSSELHKFYEDNKADILKDLTEIGKKATMQKWQILQGSMSRLAQRWGVDKQTETKVKPARRQKKKTAAPSPSPAPTPEPAVAHSNNNMPPLPPFDKTWDIEVQLRWLDVWGARR